MKWYFWIGIIVVAIIVTALIVRRGDNKIIDALIKERDTCNNVLKVLEDRVFK